MNTDVYGMRQRGQTTNYDHIKCLGYAWKNGHALNKRTVEKSLKCFKFSHQRGCASNKK